ncbi:hypothetical protein [Bacillus cereus]|nr:hypothetical protein [Bacillus cereus]
MMTTISTSNKELNEKLVKSAIFSEWSDATKYGVASAGCTLIGAIILKFIGLL